MSPDDYNYNDEHVKSEQLEIAIKALHVISVMPTAESEFLSDVALDALREMETHGILYNYNDD
jgi:hypothetical protein